MRISLLLKREPFPEIFERTLEDFLQSRFNATYSVTWHASGTTVSVNSNSQTWLCNSLMNAIFVQGTNRQVLLPVIQEFSRSIRPWRTPLQKLYVWLATTKFTSRLLSTASVEISPPLNNPKNKLIIGGNHHIRLLDYNENCCYVINKSGFNKEFISNETRVRRENPFLPTPAIMKIADDGTWYSEELVLGTPINRLKDPLQAKEAVRKVSAPLFQLYEKTKEIKRTRDYAGSLIHRISGHIDNLLFNISLKEDISGNVRALERIIGSLAGEDAFITTVQSHGDFQPANILVYNEKAWLIDWEYTNRRQTAYDGLVYSLASRFPAGLGRRIAGMFNSNRNSSNEFMRDWPEADWDNKGKKLICIIIFLLEELLLKLEEVSVPVFKAFDQGFIVFLEEFKSSVQELRSI